MENNMEGMEIIKMATEKVNEAVEKANILATESMLQYDTMSQIYLEKEKLYLQKLTDSEERHAKETESMRKHYQKIIIAISLVLLLIVGSLVAGAIYILSNYDFAVATYQEVNTEGGGDSTIEDGIRFNQNPTSEDSETEE